MQNNNVQSIRNEFIRKKQDGEIVDLGSTKVIEIIGASFEADENIIFGELNKEYIDAEIKWYHTQSLSVDRLGSFYGKVPAIWDSVCSKSRKINSNYGYLIFSQKNCSQFDHVIHELLRDRNSRRATMIYNRPSIWKEYNEDGMSDYICTNSVSYQIRDDKLHVVVQMRSNDAWAGYRNDRAWQLHVQSLVIESLQDYDEVFENLTHGTILWQVQNIHFYERNFGLIPNE